MLDNNKVFMFSTVHNWLDTRILKKEYIALVNAGFEVSLFAVEDKKFNDISLYCKNNSCIKLFKQEEKKISRIKRWKTVYRAAIESNAKYYHFHDPELLYVAAKIKRKKKDAVIIYDMHELFPAYLKTKEWIPKYFRNILSWITEKIEKYFMKKCDGVIFAEKSYKKYYQKLKLASVDILNYPILDTNIINLDNQKKRKYNQRKNLIYVGDVTEDRNTLGMVHLVKQLEDLGVQVNLKIIGPNNLNREIQTQVNDFVNEHKLNEKIQFLGRLPYEEIWSHLREADLGLCMLLPIPNYTQSMATKIYEYMTIGLPVIASDFPLWRKLLCGEKQAGIVINPLNIKEASIKIGDLLLNQEKLETLSNNGTYLIKNEFNWQIEGNKLLMFYKSFY